MKLKNPFRKREAKGSSAGPLLVRWGGAQPRFTPRAYAQLADEGYRRNVIAYRAVSLVSRCAAAVPWTLHRNGARLLSHPLLDLLHRPNPGQGGAELFGALFAFHLISGNAFLEAVSPLGADPAASNKRPPPRELWALRPDRMSIIPGAHGTPQSYRYSVDGTSVDFPVDLLTGRARVLHVRTFHPLDDWYGLSPLEAAAVSVDQHNDAAKWNASLLQSGGRPSGALVYRPPHPESPDALSPEQRSALKEELERFFTGADNAGRPLVLEGGLDWREMSISPKDMDWLAGKDVSAREIALAFHVPPQLIGISDSLTYANMEQARLALYDDAVLPLLDQFRDALNNWLAPMFGPDLVLGPDLDGVEALAPRREKTWARVAAADFLTADEKRTMVGLGKVRS
jgi:HK97 family phage portal protein